jgi:hypothetical protein
MYRAPSPLSLGLLSAVLLFPFAASAKAPTVMVMISGGGLRRAIKITDPGVLALSNVWGGEFLDISKTPENEPPKGLHAYEVSFFVRLSVHDVRKKYVAYYYPDNGKQGFFFLPGNGADYWLNVGTIFRKGFDGKWNYASPKWEALVKPALNR